MAKTAIILVACLLVAYGHGEEISGEAQMRAPRQANNGQLTNYCSYPPCCRTSGITYTAAERRLCPGNTECEDFNGCRWEGQFAYCTRTRTQVINQNIVAFFTTRGDMARYIGKTLRITQGSRSIEAIVCDTCGDSDCGGCCTRNAQPSGYLVDLESNTYDRAGFTGGGTVQWTCLNC